MSEKQFKLSSEIVLQYQIMNNNIDVNENEVVNLLNQLNDENEKLRIVLNEAEDMIETRLAEHYIQQYRNIKRGVLHEG